MITRRTLVSIHLWLGLIVGALWALQGLTGAMMVFNRDIQPLILRASPTEGEFLPLDQIFDRASASAGERVTQLENFTPEPHLLLAYYEDAAGQTKQLVVDARDGTVLDRRDPKVMMPSGGSTWYWLLRLHESLLAGENGPILVGVSGLLLLSSVIMGLVIAWPKRRQWGALFSPLKWRTTAQRLYGWHRMTGVMLGAALIFSATCGTYLAFAPILRPMFASTGHFIAPFKAKPTETLAKPAISAQDALDIARSRFPGSILVRSTLPSEKAPVFGFRLLQRDEWRRWAGTTTIFIEPANGEVISTYNPLTAPFLNKLNDNFYPLHTGEAGGPLLRIFVFFGGLSLPTLYILGVWGWARRRKRQANTAFSQRARQVA